MTCAQTETYRPSAVMPETPLSLNMFNISFSTGSETPAAVRWDADCFISLSQNWSAILSFLTKHKLIYMLVNIDDCWKQNLETKSHVKACQCFKGMFLIHVYVSAFVHKTVMILNVLDNIYSHK